MGLSRTALTNSWGRRHDDWPGTSQRQRLALALQFPPRQPQQQAYASQGKPITQRLLSASVSRRDTTKYGC